MSLSSDGHGPRLRQRGRRDAQPDRPPLKIVQVRRRTAWSEFLLSALYEGPPGKVHGGVLALVLDQIFGEAAAAGGYARG